MPSYAFPPLTGGITRRELFFLNNTDNVCYNPWTGGARNVSSDKTILRELAAGRRVQVANSGGSMRGRIGEEELATIAPVVAAGREIEVDDIVYVRIRKDRFVCHLVKDAKVGRFLIGDNLVGIDGWVGPDTIYGKVVRVGEAPEFDGVTVRED
jgi:hypothetical protein